MCSSPQLFAAYHVFHRLSVPRHPPCALLRLTNNLKAVGNDLFGRCRLACIRAYKSLTNHLRSKGYEIGRRPMNNRFYSACFKSFASSVTLLWLFFSRMSLSRLFANFDTLRFFVIRFSRYKQKSLILKKSEISVEELASLVLQWR